MGDVLVPLAGDADVSHWLDVLVAKGLLEELAPVDREERCFRITQKAQRLVQVTDQLSELIGQGPWDELRLALRSN